VNVIFQVIQNILRRKEQQGVCPHCGHPLPPPGTSYDMDESGEPGGQNAQSPDASRCPSCGRPLSGDDTP